MVAGTDTVILRPEKLEVRGLVKRYGATRRREGTLAVDGIDITVRAGELVCIVGASGCGKSTLLNIVAGLEDTTEGAVTIDGERVIGPGPDRGMVFQGYSLFPWKTVRENIAYGLEETGVPRAERPERVDRLIEVMGLGKWQDRIPRELSGGMRQRVAIARALAPEPDVLLLDEPFGALDAQTKRAMQDHLLEVWRRTGATIMMVTHDVEEAVYLSSRVYVLTSHPGRVAAEVPVPFPDDRTADVKHDPGFMALRDEIQGLLTGQVAA